MRTKRFSVLLTELALILAVASAFQLNARAANRYKVLYSFKGGADGITPLGDLTFDTAGNLYGTTSDGGTGSCNSQPPGCGTVFELTTDSSGQWAETVLHSFDFSSDGAYPFGGLIFDTAGDLYGTTSSAGTVFELMQGSGGWTESVLDRFGNQNDGSGPCAGLIWDATGNLYGTTITGGEYGGGVVFKLTPGSSGWTETVLYNFCAQSECSDGFEPEAALVIDASGNLYGTTVFGGNRRAFACDPGDGCGVVFELSPASGGWKYSVLHKFRGPDGAFPTSSLILDKKGSLYGTTPGDGAFGYGAVFKLTPAASGRWKYGVLYNFRTGGGANSLSMPVALDAAGNLYGTTSASGTQACNGGDCGEVYKLAAGAHGRWKFSALYKFTGGQDGGQPSSGLIFDQKGILYGTAAIGGANGDGVVFKVTP